MHCSSVVYFRVWLRRVKWKAWSYMVRELVRYWLYFVNQRNLFLVVFNMKQQKIIIWGGKSDFTCCSEVVVEVVIWL